MSIKANIWWRLRSARRGARGGLPAKQILIQLTILRSTVWIIIINTHAKPLKFRVVGRSENPGVPVIFGGHNLPPLVEIGLTAPALPGTTGLNTEVNDYNKTTQGQTLQAYEPAKSIAQSKNCQINSNHLHGKEKLRKQPRFHNSSFRELDVVKLSDLGGIHILRKQSYVSYDGNPIKF